MATKFLRTSSFNGKNLVLIKKCNFKSVGYRNVSGYTFFYKKLNSISDGINPKGSLRDSFFIRNRISYQMVGFRNVLN